jgi:hypothetical protein
MKTGIVLALILISAVGELAQEHAILPEQCRADIRLWTSQKKNENDRLSYGEITRRSAEMWNCMSVDRGAGESLSQFKDDSDNYKFLWTAYTAVSEQRLQHFVVRHNLAKQFKDEDAAGLR